MSIFSDKNIRRILLDSWSVSWPMTIIMLFEFFIGLSDVYVAGRFGKTAQAAYGLAFQLYFVFIIIGMALSVGSVSVISRLFTARQKDDFGIAVNSSFAVSAASGALFTILGIIFAKNTIMALGISQEVAITAVPLLVIYSFGLIFDYVLMNTNSILRACDMIKRSLFAMTVVCLMNIVLNFVLGLHTPLGLRGIAVATVISLFTGSVINIFYTKKLMPRNLNISKKMIMRILAISWPSGLLQVMWQLGGIVLFMIIGMLPQRSVEIMAAFTNGMKIESAIFLPAFAFNMANAVVVGNLLGKKEKTDAFNGGILTAVSGVGIVIFLTVIIILNARFIAVLLSDNPAVAEESVRYIYIAMIAEPLMAWSVILSGALNGAGDTRTVMAIISFSMWCVRIPLAYLLAIHLKLGAAAIWWAMNISIFVHSALISRHYFKRRWIDSSEISVPS